MQRARFALVAAAFSVVFLSAGTAQAGPYPFGDEPYRLNWGYDPEIESGCWKWNWQQYQWNDYCARYVYPKAYLYPRSSRVVLRTRG
jgi:hypothetical protein